MSPADEIPDEIPDIAWQRWNQTTELGVWPTGCFQHLGATGRGCLDLNENNDEKFNILMSKYTLNYYLGCRRYNRKCHHHGVVGVDENDTGAIVGQWRNSGAKSCSIIQPPITK